MEKLLYWQINRFRRKKIYMLCILWIMSVLICYGIKEYIESGLILESRLGVVCFLFCEAVIVFTIWEGWSFEKKNLDQFKRLKGQLQGEELKEVDDYLNRLFHFFDEKQVCEVVTSVLSKKKIYQWGNRTNRVHLISDIEEIVPPLFMKMFLGFTIVVNGRDICVGNYGKNQSLLELQKSLNQFMYFELVRRYQVIQENFAQRGGA